MFLQVFKRRSNYRVFLKDFSTFWFLAVFRIFDFFLKLRWNLEGTHAHLHFPSWGWKCQRSTGCSNKNKRKKIKNGKHSLNNNLYFPLFNFCYFRGTLLSVSGTAKYIPCLSRSGVVDLGLIYGPHSGSICFLFWPSQYQFPLGKHSSTD